MGSSSESEDDLPPSKPDVAKKEAPMSYLTLLNSNNKFSEMLKNKIRQTESSPILSKRGFNPIASSTQIGTPTELKHEAKHNDSSSSDSKLKQKTKNISSSVKPRKKEEKTAPHTSQKVKVRKSSDSSVDSESDSESSVSLPGQTKHDSSNWEGEISKKANSPFGKLNFAKFARESPSSERKRGHTKSKSTLDHEPYAQIKVEMPSDTEPTEERKVLKKAKPESRRKQSSSESSEDSSKRNRLPPSNGNATSHSLHTKGGSFEEKKLKNHNLSSLNAKNKGEKSSPLQQEKTDSTSDDSDNDRHTKTKPTDKGPLSRLRTLELEDSLEVIQTRFNGFENIKPKEDVYIVEIPVKLDPSRLIGASISLSGSIRVNKKYESVTSHNHQEPITVCDNGESEKFRIIKPVGSIRLQRRLDSKKVPDVPNMADRSVSFPTNLKSRHPLFGSNFDKKIALEEHIKMKLESIGNSVVEEKTKKKKKKKKHKSETAEHQEEEIFKFLSQKSEERDHVEEKKKKKKKRKAEESEYESEAGTSGVKRKCEESEDTLIREMLMSQIATLDMQTHKKKKKKG